MSVEMKSRLVDLEDLRAATPRDESGRFIACLVCGDPLHHVERSGRTKAICDDEVCRGAYSRYWHRAQARLAGTPWTRARPRGES